MTPMAKGDGGVGGNGTDENGRGVTYGGHNENDDANRNDSGLTGSGSAPNSNVKSNDKASSATTSGSTTRSRSASNSKKRNNIGALSNSKIRRPRVKSAGNAKSSNLSTGNANNSRDPHERQEAGGASGLDGYLPPS